MTAHSTPTTDSLPLSALDLQVLLVLAKEDLYGYAILKTLEDESDGVLSPGIGTLYRVLARLADLEWVEETDAPKDDDETHRGKPRKYYRLTELGRNVARREVERLEKVVRQARRLGPEVIR